MAQKKKELGMDDKKWETVGDGQPREEHLEARPTVEFLPLLLDPAFIAYMDYVAGHILWSMGIPLGICAGVPTTLDLAGMAFERSLEALGRCHRLGIHRFNVWGVSRSMVRAGGWLAD